MSDVEVFDFRDTAGRPVRFARTLPSRRKRVRKPTLAGVAKQATRAGLEISKYEVSPDGKIGIVLGKPADATSLSQPHVDASEWD
jgi:hypothetical protein